MQLEEYFHFLAPNDIRIKGSRIGVESVLNEYIHNAKSPEEIEKQFHSIDLQQIYATILYYLQNKEKMDLYLSEWLEYGFQMRENQEKNPSLGMIKLRRLRGILKEKGQESHFTREHIHEAMQILNG